MFSFSQTPVMFAGLLILFAWCTAWSTVELLRSRTASDRIMTGLHLFMSVVMLAMVPRPSWAALSGVIPTPVLSGLFVLGAAWFVWAAVRAGRDAHGTHAGHAGHTGHLIGHAVMFGAMAWHLAGMAVAMATMMGHDGSGHGGSGHSDMGHAMAPAPAMMVVAWVGVPLMIALLVMGVADLVGCLRPATPGARRPHLAMGAAMNLGMFWMSVGLVAPLLPFLSVLQR